MKPEDRRYIIVEYQDGRPMVWHEFSKQIVYAGRRLKVQHYSKKEATKLMRKSTENRISWGIEPIKYSLIQIQP